MQVRAPISNLEASASGFGTSMNVTYIPTTATTAISRPKNTEEIGILINSSCVCLLSLAGHP